MVIGLARQEDILVCGGIYSAAFSMPPYREYWSPSDAAEMLGELLRKDAESCWCAEDQGRVVGFAFCTTFGRFRGVIQEFAVDPEFQKQGIGTTLLAYVLDRMEERGIRTADLVVNRDAPAYRLYRRFGFTPPGKYVLLVKWL